MNELATEAMESSKERIKNESGSISNHDGARLSPLPRAHGTLSRTWFECEAITRELTGDPLESGDSELMRPFTLIGLRSSIQRIRPAWGWPEQRAMRAGEI
ncbi:MAG: hypothetical protein ACREXS_06960 [Gammaproteobacteria bacterium]